MRLLPERSPTPRLIIAASLPVLAGALLLARSAPEFLLDAAHCPLRDMTGLPCPTCGGTRAVTELAAGHWQAAWRANPLLVLVGAMYLPTAALAVAATVVPAWRRQWCLTEPEKKTAGWLALALILANWIWLALR